MTSFVKKFVEAITIKLIVEIIFAVFIAVFGYLNRDIILNILFYQTPAWITITTALLLLFFLGIGLAIRSKTRSKGVFLAIPRRPEHILKVFSVDVFGVKWEVLYGTYMFSGEPYAFSQGPYCPKCMFEMDSEERGLLFKKYYWKCVPCSKYYRIPEKSSYDASRAVEKYIESEIRSGHLKIERRD